MIFSYLVTAFIVMPLLELWLLLQLGGQFGWRPTLLLVVLTGITGAWLARVQGMRTVLAIRGDLAAGRMPAPRLIDGVMILIAGVLLITPGLITDAAGFLLLTPPVRVMIRTWLRRLMEQKLREGTVSCSFRGW